MNKILPKPIIVGTAVFALLYVIHIMILPVLGKSLQGGEGGAMFVIHQMLGVATCFVSGYVAARIAGKRGFFYGFNVGALGTVLSALAAVAWSKIMGSTLPLGLSTLPFWIFVNGSLAGFAGLLFTNPSE